MITHNLSLLVVVVDIAPELHYWLSKSVAISIDLSWYGQSRQPIALTIG